MGAIAVESTMFALLVATYFYLRLVVPAWPPAGTPLPGLVAPPANVLLLLASVLPMAAVHRAALRQARRPVWLGLAACAGLGLVALALRVFEFRALHTRWDRHAYGAIVWGILAVHTIHLLAATGETALLAAIVRGARRQPKHFVDVDVNAVYWYFVAGAWLLLWGVVFVAPRLIEFSR